MNHLQYICLLALMLAAASATSINTRDDVVLPTFEPITCPVLGFSFCLTVKYNNAEVSEDLILANESPKAPTVLKGHLDSNGRKVVIILKDAFNEEDTIVFKAEHAGGCTRFSVDIEGSGETTCLKSEHRPQHDNDVPGGREPKASDRSLEEIQLSPRELDPNGYKLTVAVYYDDLFQKQFGDAARTRIEAVMAIVDEMYSEKDTLKTEIDVNLVGVVHKSGCNWGEVKNWWRELSPWSSSPVAGSCSDLSGIATGSPHEANLYVFLTGSKSKDGLGLANLDTVCDSDRKRRVNINKYAAGSQKGGDAYTAETVAHEMGHNLGLDHDCLNFNCAYWSSSYKGPRKINGVECYGYMDYKDETNYWSACSVADLTLYINKQANGFCLPPLNGSPNTTPAPTTPAPTTPAGNVCKNINIVTKNWGKENSWTLGKCNSAKEYTSHKTFTEECCQPAGNYKLVCKDSWKDGWHGGYIKINGKKYCKQFRKGHEKIEEVNF